jgi:hypothetical protein
MLVISNLSVDDTLISRLHGIKHEIDSRLHACNLESNSR